MTARIRDAIERIRREHVLLARHFEHSIHTGTFCSYEPDEPVEWRL